MYNELYQDVRSFHLVLKRLEDGALDHESLVYHEIKQHGRKLGHILRTCDEVLGDVRGFLRKHRGLQQSYWDRIKFVVKDMKEIESIRSRIGFQMTVIDTYINVSGSSHAGRLEIQRPWLPRYQEESGDPAANGPEWSQESLLTTYSNDEKEKWKEWRRSMISNGFRSADLERHGSSINSYALSLIRIDTIEEEPQAVLPLSRPVVSTTSDVSESEPEDIPESTLENNIPTIVEIPIMISSNAKDGQSNGSPECTPRNPEDCEVSYQGTHQFSPGLQILNHTIIAQRLFEQSYGHLWTEAKLEDAVLMFKIALQQLNRVVDSGRDLSTLNEELQQCDLILNHLNNFVTESCSKWMLLPMGETIRRDTLQRMEMIAANLCESLSQITSRICGMLTKGSNDSRTQKTIEKSIVEETHSVLTKMCEEYFSFVHAEWKGTKSTCKSNNLPSLVSSDPTEDQDMRPLTPKRPSRKSRDPELDSGESQKTCNSTNENEDNLCQYTHTDKALAVAPQIITRLSDYTLDHRFCDSMTVQEQYSAGFQRLLHSADYFRIAWYKSFGHDYQLRNRIFNLWLALACVIDISENMSIDECMSLYHNIKSDCERIYKDLDRLIAASEPSVLTGEQQNRQILEERSRIKEVETKLAVVTTRLEGAFL